MTTTTTTLDTKATDGVEKLGQPHNYGGGCRGDGCEALDVWPLHTIRRRGGDDYLALCTSCVLKYHPGSFCASCFDLFSGSPSSSKSIPGVVHCSRCTSVSHIACLPDPQQASHYLCPVCANPNGFSYFPVGVRMARAPDGKPYDPHDGRERKMDLKVAKVLMLASQLAYASTNKTLAHYRGEAERKVKELLVMKRRASEMLESSNLDAKRKRIMEEMERGAREQAFASLTPEVRVADRQRNMSPRPSGAMASRPSGAMASAVAAQKRVQSREREKLMKFHDPMPRVPVPSAHVAGLNDKMKGPFVAGLPNQSASSQKRVDDDQRNRILLDSKSRFAAGDGRVKLEAQAYRDTDPQIPPPNNGPC